MLRAESMEVIYYPHPALRWKSKPVKQIDSRLRGIVQEMLELMYEAKGIGLAANQVALPLRVFVINPSGDPELSDEELVFINPVLSKRKGSEEGEEGCLSLPDLFGPVRRSEEITVEAFDLQGREFKLELSDMPARVVQHEYDHLDGVLFPDRMTDTSRRELEPKLKEFETVFRRRQEAGLCLSDEELKAQLRDLEPA